MTGKSKCANCPNREQFETDKAIGRDMDLICIPWTEKPSEPFDVVTAICKEFALRPAMTDGGPCAKKLHGRMAYAIVFAGGGFIDLSFMPVVPTEKKE